MKCLAKSLVIILFYGEMVNPLDAHGSIDHCFK
jgi:hypothetical protein